MKTSSLTTKDIVQKWYLIDCSGKKLGRLSVQIANILRGKNKPEYTPNQDCGDNLIIINSDLIQLKGKKAENKIYYRHTGFPGGIKETTPNKMKEKNKSDEMFIIEVEKKCGDDAGLHKVVQHLQDKYGIEPCIKTKGEMGMEFVAPHLIDERRAAFEKAKVGREKDYDRPYQPS